MRQSEVGPDPTPSRTTWRSAIVLAYAGAGLAIVLLSGLTTRIDDVPLTAELGLFEMLPATYWLGLSLVAVATVLALRSGSDGLVALTGGLMLAILAGTPSLFESTPRYWDSYAHFSEAQVLVQFPRSAPAPLHAYSTNWPGSFLIMWTLSGSGGVAPLDFLTLFPFLVGGITFLAIFEFLRSTFSHAIAREACVPTALFAVWAQYHVSPQSLGFILALAILATIWRRGTEWRIVAAALSVSLVVSHPTSAILLLNILTAIAVLSLFRRFRTPASKEESRRQARFSLRVGVTFATMWLAWLFFRAVGSSEAARTAILTRMDVLWRIPEETLNLATARTLENMFTWAPLVRFASLGLFGFVGLVSLAAIYRDRHSRDQFRFFFGALVSLTVVAVADIFAFGGQFYDRSLLLFAILAPALCLTGLRRIRLPRGVKRGMVLLLVGASVATASTAYYLEAFNVVHEEAIAATDFVVQLPPGSVVVDGMYPAPLWLEPGERPSLIRLTFEQVYPQPLESIDSSRSVYAVFDPTAELWHRQWFGTNIYREYLDARPGYSLIYDNGRTEIFSVRS